MLVALLKIYYHMEKYVQNKAHRTIIYLILGIVHSIEYKYFCRRLLTLIGLYLYEERNNLSISRNACNYKYPL